MTTNTDVLLLTLFCAVGLGRTTAADCNTSLWTAVKTACGSCRVVTDSVSTYKTCSAYCQAMEAGLACVEAWEVDDDSCDVLAEADCNTDFETAFDEPTSDMGCRCEEVADSVTTIPTEPAVYSTDSVATIPTEPAVYSTDMATPDSTSQPTTTEEPPQSTATPVCNLDLWTWVKRDCGPCRVLSGSVSNHKTCRAYCQKMEGGLDCVGAWENQDGSCDDLLDATCDTDFETAFAGTSDMVCQCQAPDDASDPDEASVLGDGFDPVSAGPEDIYVANDGLVVTPAFGCSALVFSSIMYFAQDLLW